MMFPVTLAVLFNQDFLIWGSWPAGRIHGRSYRRPARPQAFAKGGSVSLCPGFPARCGRILFRDSEGGIRWPKSATLPPWW
jgi:hypothetical protein